MLANGQWLPPETQAEFDPTPHVGLAGDDLAYVYAGPEHLGQLSAENFAKTLSEWKRTWPGRPAGGRMIHYLWELVDHNGAQIVRDAARLLAVSRSIPSLTLSAPPIASRSIRQQPSNPRSPPTPNAAQS